MLDNNHHILSHIIDGEMCAQLSKTSLVDQIASGVCELPNNGGIYPIETSQIFLTEPNRHVRNAMVFIHDGKRNAVSCCDFGKKLLETSTYEENKWVIICPQFLHKMDLEHHQPLAKYEQCLTWDSDWQYGGLNRSSDKVISSFGLLDGVLLKLCDSFLFPNLQHIVVVGHGEGADFIHRYTIASKLPEITIPVHFVIANPGSYVFFDDAARPDPTCTPTTHPEAYRWPYGTNKIPLYCQTNDPKELFARFAAKEIILLLENDRSGSSDSGLDMSIPALAQGPTRFQRGESFLKSIETYRANCKKNETVPNSLFACHKVPQRPSSTRNSISCKKEDERMIMLSSMEGIEAIFRHVQQTSIRSSSGSTRSIGLIRNSILLSNNVTITTKTNHTISSHAISSSSGSSSIMSSSSSSDDEMITSTKKQTTSEAQSTTSALHRVPSNSTILDATNADRCVCIVS